MLILYAEILSAILLFLYRNIWREICLMDVWNQVGSAGCYFHTDAQQNHFNKAIPSSSVLIYSPSCCFRTWFDFFLHKIAVDIWIFHAAFQFVSLLQKGEKQHLWLLSHCSLQPLWLIMFSELWICFQCECRLTM